MSGCSSRRPEVEQLVAAYRADLRAADMFAEHPVTSSARTFLTRVGIAGWQQLSPAEQCATSLTERRVVGWLMAKLLQAARNDEDPFVRLCVEFLARTGMRKGEFLDLTVDSVVQIGAAYWLHVPLGKLRSDRYIPLHPQLKQLLVRVWESALLW